MSLSDVLRERVQAFEERRRELEAAASDPARASKPDFGKILRELGSVQKLLGTWTRYLELEQQIAENRELAESGDEELGALATEELPSLERELEKSEAEILDRVLEDDDDGDRAAIVEVRAGTGGDEASLFVADLFRIYSKHAELRGWKLEVLDSSESEAGGFKEITFQLDGSGAYREMRFETGGHRVQRVPATETQGRIHTSAATVAVLPEVEEVDFELRPEDLEITAMRAGGPGGQHVNKTSSAVRVVHKPSGMAVRCQDGKSQHRNKAKAIELLRSRLYELEKTKRDAERTDLRRTQVGTGDRSQRIRTYNWPQNRVTDHRLGRNFSLEHVLEARLDAIFEALLAAEREAKLANL